jgi:Na+/proline symporter
VKDSSYAEAYMELETRYERVHQEKQDHLRAMLDALEVHSEPDLKNNVEKIQQKTETEMGIRDEATELIQKANPDADTNDINYIFLSFVVNFLPIGLVGLVLAAILSASMSSTAAELNALASVTVVDIYKRAFKKNASERHYLIASKLATVFWGIYAINFAMFANRLGSLIEAVNILGSLFYGTILGIFLIAFYFKKIGGHATFIAAIIAELTVLGCYFFTEIPYLWFNVIGCVLLITLAHIMNPFFAEKSEK